VVDDIAAGVAGPAFAERFAVAVADAAEQVARRRLLGHRRLALLPPRFRFRAVKGFDYLLVYNAEHPDRLVLRVVHTARDLAPLLGDAGPLRPCGDGSPQGSRVREARVWAPPGCPGERKSSSDVVIERPNDDMCGYLELLPR
jgi:plasmid stabilization system protein ParE